MSANGGHPARMNKSAVFSRCESADNCSYEFDYQADYTAFLEEAKKTVQQQTLLHTTPRVEASGEKQLINIEKKNRKSWKSSLFSFLKIDKRGRKPDPQSTDVKIIPKPKPRHVSGPVRGNVGQTTNVRARTHVSGPLAGLFHSTKGGDEYKVPYMCLGSINDDHKIHSYGPVYLVT